jgi:hypothetical protein
VSGVPQPRVRAPRYVALIVAAGVIAAATRAGAFCRCARPLRPHCADASAQHRITVDVDFTVVDGTVEVLTQSGPYELPVADLDGKAVLFVLTPRGEVFQGLPDALPGSITAGTMHGATASLTTQAAFLPGEYELALFIDVVPGGGVGPQRGDLAAFDNTVCDPTGVSVRVAVGCADATVTLENRHFIVF